MIQRLACWALAAVLAGAANAQAPLRFARYPSLSPDGSQVAFVWQSDIWIAATSGGPARPLTTNPAEDTRPVWSPDGRSIAYSSARAGSWDVWLQELDGGAPRRLTFHGGTETVRGFSPDGLGVVFGSRREGNGLGPGRRDFLAPVAGGPPTRLQAVDTIGGVLSPSGDRFAFVRGAVTGTRRHYQGPAAEDIWVHDLKADTYLRVTDQPGVDTDPQWLSEDELLYASERSGTTNLWHQRLADGTALQLTQHEQPVNDPGLARDGKSVVYDCDQSLWLLRLPNGTPQRLAITVPADHNENREIWRTLRDGVREYAVSPDGHEAALVVRGDLYVVRFPEGGPTSQLTDTSAEEGGISWSADSKTLYFHSDRDGQYDLYKIESGNAGDKRLRRASHPVVVRLTQTAEDERDPLVSPDGKRLCYVRGRGDLMVADLSADGTMTAITAAVTGWSWPSAQWSPDSRWLAFSREDENENTDVFIVKADGTSLYNVSRHPGRDWGPTWSGDGSKLGFLGRREGDQTEAWFVWLKAADFELTAAERRDREDAQADPPPPPKPPPPEPSAAADPADPPAPTDPPVAPPNDPQTMPPPSEPEKTKATDATPSNTASNDPKAVVIDLDGLSDRLVRLTSSITDEGDLAASPDGEEFVYTALTEGQRDLWAVKWNGDKRRRLTTGLSPYAVSWAPNGKQIRFLRSPGQLGSVSPSGGSVQMTGHEAAVRRVLAEERAYLLERIWRIMRDEYYDPTLHGIDWAGLLPRYRELAAEAPSEAEFDHVVNLMLGEVNSSHMGYGHSRAAATTPVGDTPAVAGELGVVWSADGQRVERVLATSPAAREASRLEPGDRITAVDGVPLGQRTVDELLLGQAERLVQLRVVNEAGDERTVDMRPMAATDLAEAQYEDWVRSRRKLVDEFSDGRLGYLHIRAMDDVSLTKFERELFAAGEGKAGLLVDVRFNGGGSTADRVLAMLTTRAHAWAVPRGGPPGYPVSRLYAPTWRKPVALLINPYSVSNAEILAHAFNELELGPTVGEPTNGGVISTGSVRLFDGSTLRLPLRGWQRLSDGADLEGNPAEPTVPVANEPADEAVGRDPQLEAAVRALLVKVAE